MSAGIDPQALQDSLAALDCLPAPLALLDRHGVILSVNEAWRQVLRSGVPGGGVGANYLQVCEAAQGEGAEDARAAGTGIRSVLQGALPSFALEYPCHTPEERRWFRLLATPLPAGHAASALILHVDITQRRRDESQVVAAERDAREANQRLDFVLHESAIGDWSLDVRTNAITRSLRHDQCFGYTALVPLWGYDTFLAHLLPADRARIHSAVQGALAGTGDYDVEFRTLWPDGSLHWLWGRGTVEFDAQGKPLRMAGIVADITGRKQAENRLRRSEANLAASQRIAHLGSWELDLVDVQDLSGGALRWSDEVFRIWGYEPGGLEVTYENFLKAVHPDDRALIGAAVEGALRESRSYDLTHRIVRPDGAERVVREQAEFLFDEATGRPVRMIGTVLDITVQRRAEKTIERALERLTEAQRIGQIGDWEWDLATGQISWSLQVFHIYGRDPRLGPPGDLGEVSRQYDAASVAREQERTERALATGEPQEYELVLRRPDGERLFLQAMAFVRKDGAGKVTGIYGTVQDITRRKRSEKRFRRLVESNVQGVFFWKAGGDVADANDAFLEMTGYTRADLAAGRVNRAAMTPAESAPLDAQAAAEIAATGICKPYEKEFLRRDGSRLPVLVGAASFADDPGEGVCFVLDLRDRKRLEQQFLRAQRLESIGRLTGGIAHDLNNILSPILLLATLVKEKLPDPEDAEQLKMIEQAAVRGADLLKQLLTFGRGIEGGRGLVRLPVLLKEMVTLMRETFPREITVAEQLGMDLSAVTGDATQLHQVLMNLCVNARDAMPAGGTLTIAAANAGPQDPEVAARGPSSGSWVCITISDTGEGIEPANLDRIFEPFFTTKEIGRGTGLGLSTVLGIVKGHGGFVTVSSEPGRGTTFKVYLPASQGTAREAAAERLGSHRGAQELVLVVDDEEPIQRSVRRVLERRDYRVVTASSAEEALRIFDEANGKIAVVLTDLMMPGIGGVELIRELRARAPRLPIVATTGLQDRRRDEVLAALGIHELLLKPFTEAELLRALGFSSEKLT